MSGRQGTRTVAAAAAILALALAGCAPRLETPGAKQRRVMAQVIDEKEFPAQAAQVEGETLEFLTEPAGIFTPRTPRSPSFDELLADPAKHRGAFVSFRGKLAELPERLRPGGLVLLEKRGAVAFLGSVSLGRRLIRPGEAVEVTGFFLKRWVALDASGRGYVAMPLLACLSVTPLAGQAAESLEKLRPPPGLLPIAELEVPPVWSRPVVELDARGALRLDGRAAGREALAGELARRAAAEPKTPLGEASLVAVVLLDPAVSAADVKTLQTVLPVKAVFRPAGKQ